jgi:ParB family chromosome partitioning protein
MSKPIPISAINEDRFPPIRPIKEGGVDAVQATVKELGIIEPVIVVGPNSRTGKYDFLIGWHRLEAAKRAGLKVIPAVVRKYNKKQALLAQMVENLGRTEMTELEEARVFQRLVDENGMTMQEIADSLGGKKKRTKANVSQRLQLLKLHENVQLALEHDLINFTDARELRKLSKAEQSAAVMEVLLEQGVITAPEPTEEGKAPSSKDLLKTAGSKKPPSKPSTPKKKGAKKKAPTKTQTQRKVSQGVRQQVASRAGQKPGAATGGKTLKERYAAARPKLIQDFSDHRDGMTAAQEKLAGEVLDFLFERTLLLVRS